jgi:hypothetical protein
MKVYFTAEEMHTPEYKEYVRWMSNVWRLNDERNKHIEQRKQRMQELNDIALIDEGMYED